MPASVLGHLLLKRYEELVLKLYCEPKEDIIMGSFIERVQVGIVERNQPHQNQPAIKKRKATDQPKMPKTKDIRSFFNNKNNSNEGPTTKKKLL